MSKVTERFMAKVNQTNDCWIWMAYKRRDGYGEFHLEGSTQLSHRVSYEMFKGRIPDGLDIDHMCHNRSCVNPDHLQAVDRSLNNQNRRSAQSNSKSGVRGVSLCKTTGRWRVVMTENKKSVHVGRFDSIDRAELAAIEYRQRNYPNSLKDLKSHDLKEA